MRIQSGFGLALTAFLASSAAAGPTPAPLTGDQEPDWLKKPRPEDIMALWPKEAMAKGINGKAVIHCKVSLQGALFDCIVLSETPAGMGFGGAAIALTPQLLMRPQMHDGHPVPGGEVTIPLNFAGMRPNTDQQFMGRSNLSIGNWLEAPNYADVVAAFPPRARAKGLGGHVVLECTLQGGGRLGDCRAGAEEPRGLGFGDAARKLAPQFRGPDKLDNGKPTKGMDTHVPITFAPEMLQSGPPMTGKPRWTVLPTAEQMRDGFPKVAGPEAITLRVVLDCAVETGGAVGDCKVDSEQPAGAGVGAAALAVSKYFRMTIWTSEGLPTVGGRVHIPIRYELPALEKPAPGKP